MFETTEVAPVVETPAQDAAPIQDAAPAPAEAPDEWKGELEGMEKQPWYASLSDEAKANLRKGTEETYRGWQRAFTKKSMGLAEERKKFGSEQETWKEQQAREKKELEAHLESERQRIQKMLYGDDDPVASARSEWEQEKKTIEETHATAVADYQAKLKEWEDKHGALASERDAAINEWKGKHDTLQQKFEAREGEWKKQGEQARAKYADQIMDAFGKDPSNFIKADGFVPELTTYLSDEQLSRYAKMVDDYLVKSDKVFEDPKASEMAMQLMDTGMSMERAMRAVKAEFKPEVKPTPAEEAVSVGNPGGSRIVAPPPKDEDWKSMLNRKIREAEEAERGNS